MGQAISITAVQDSNQFKLMLKVENPVVGWKGGRHVYRVEQGDMDYWRLERDHGHCGADFRRTISMNCNPVGAGGMDLIDW